MICVNYVLLELGGSKLCQIYFVILTVTEINYVSSLFYGNVTDDHWHKQSCYDGWWEVNKVSDRDSKKEDLT